MKKKIKGFTLIELIVVIAIIGILAAIIVPSILGYVENSRVSNLNANAKTVYSGAQLAIVDSNVGKVDVLPNCVYTGSDDCIAYPNGTGNICDLTNYLGEDFEGYFAFMTDSQGYGCVYAVWSQYPISANSVAQLTKADVKSSIHTSTPRGCHPLLSDAAVSNGASS